MTLTRAKFEDLISDLVESTLDPVRKALKDAKLKLRMILIKYYLLVVLHEFQCVQELVKEELGKEPISRS